MRAAILAFLALITPAALAAQTFSPPHAELSSDDQPVRNVPTTGYTLSLSWAPEYCQAHRDRATSERECSDRTIRSGFVLHGLWPDGDGFNRWPQYCHPVAILNDAQIQAGIGATPSPQLLQHEWAKHGSCMTDDPVAFFTEETRIYRTIHAPDMVALAKRRGMSASDVQQAIAAANPGMTANMMRLNVNKKGWLEEVWFCLGKDRRPRPCPASQGSAKPGQSVRIQAPF